MVIVGGEQKVDVLYYLCHNKEEGEETNHFLLINYRKRRLKDMSECACESQTANRGRVFDANEDINNIQFYTKRTLSTKI